MQEDTSSVERRLCLQSLERGSNNIQYVVNRLRDLAALLHDQAGLSSIPFDLVAIMTGVGEFRQDSVGNDAKGTPLSLELDPRIPLSVEGDLTKVSEEGGEGGSIGRLLWRRIWMNGRADVALLFRFRGADTANID
jgi:signal transduction histidine kinase